MHNRDRLLAVLLVVVLLAGLIYGSTKEIFWPDAKEEVLWTSKKETIYFWYTDEALTDFIASAAVSFGEAEGVRVIPVLKSSSAFLETVNKETLDADKLTPDTYIINNDALEKAYLAGLASQVSDPDETLNEARFPATALSAVTYHGKRVAFPFYFETSVLLYNKDYLNMWVEQQAEREDQETGDGRELPVFDGSDNTPEGIPLTVDGLLKFADTFDAPEGVEGVMKWDVADIFYNYWIVGAYLNVGGEDGDDRTNLQVFNQETVDCLNVYQALNQFFYIEPNSVNYESAIQDFIDGKQVFTIAATDAIARMEKAKEDGVFNYEYGMAALPSISEELDSRALSVTDAVAVNGYSEHKELANRFAIYLTQHQAKSLYDRTGKVSASISANQADACRRVFLAQYADSISLPKLMEIGNLWLKLEALFAKVWNGEEITPLLQELEEQLATQITSQ